MNSHLTSLLCGPIMLLLFVGCPNSEKTVQGDNGHVPPPMPVPVEGALFRYSAQGNGIPCIVFGGEKIGERLYSDALREHIRFIYADQSYMEPEVAESLTFDLILDDIEKARKALRVDKLAVMGHSMFGLIPLEYAVKYPDHISHAIVTGIVPFLTDKYSEAVKAYWQSGASEERKQALDANRKKLAQQDATEMTENERFIAQYIADIPMRFYDVNYDMSDFWEGVDLNIDFVNRYAGVLLQDFDHTESYENITAPVLVIAGKYDYPCPYFLWEDVKDIIPNYTFHLFENAGHNPMLEIPDEFNRVVVEWIEGH